MYGEKNKKAQSSKPGKPKKPYASPANAGKLTIKDFAKNTYRTMTLYTEPSFSVTT
jgi:hypothetical protein